MQTLISEPSADILVAIQENPAFEILNKTKAARKMCFLPLRERGKTHHVTFWFCDLQRAKWNSTCPRLTAVSTCTVFGDNAGKCIYFSARGAQREFVWSDSRLMLSPRPPEERADYHRLSGRKRSGRIGPEPAEIRPLDADKAASFLSNTSWRKAIPETEEDSTSCCTVVWLKQVRDFKGHLGELN